MRNDIKVLDCTLRDGGYVNDWKFGESKERIVGYLGAAGIDIIELGFLRDGNFSSEQSLYNHIADVMKFIPNTKHKEFSLMVRPDWYDIRQLTEKAGLIKNIRFAFYLKDLNLTREYCKYVQDMGYHVFLNPVNICAYTESEIETILTFVNEIQPKTVTIVDTFGSLTQDKLLSVISIFDKNINDGIGLGCHLHDNMLMSVALSQTFMTAVKSARGLYIDGSLNGMGRIPGNLPLEILVDSVNGYYGQNVYDTDCIMKAISREIIPIKEKLWWGYNPVFYYSGKYVVHRSYPEYYLCECALPFDVICKLMVEISKTEKKYTFDKRFADEIYKFICDKA